MRPHLVIGASGLVGRHLLAALESLGVDARGTCRNNPEGDLLRVDLTDRAAVQELIEGVQPAVIYLPAALTAVDYCETHPAESYRTNVLGVRSVVGAARLTRSRLVYFSTDYIFDGENGPYDEDDPPNPVSEYGRHKLYAEHVVALHAEDCLIVRTTVVYGEEPQGKNFVQRLRVTLGAGARLPVPVDQVGTPTFAPDLAEATVRLACSDATGVFHVAGPDRLTRFEFAREAARIFGLDERLIEPVSGEALAQPARRPLSAGMRCRRLESALAPFRVRGCREGLMAML